MNKKQNNSIEDTGERLIPNTSKEKLIYAEHIARYKSIIPHIKGKTVLDIACGTGYGSQLIARDARNVYGVDISREAIEYAQENYPAKNIKYIVGDGTEIPIKDNSVDVVVSMETIEHIEDQDNFLKEIKRVLKPGGDFFVSTPNDKEYPKGNHFHVKEHDGNSLTKLLKKYFKNVDMYYQVDEIATSILSVDRFNKDIDTKDWHLIKNIPLNKDKCIYYIAACSDQNPKNIYELSILGEFYSYIDQDRARNEHRNALVENDKLKSEVSSLESEINRLKNSLDLISKSKGHRMVKFVGEIKRRFIK